MHLPDGRPPIRLAMNTNVTIDVRNDKNVIV